MSEIQYTTFPHRSRQLTNLNGLKFTRWTVIGYAYKIGVRHFWLCKCDCGTLKYVEHGSLRFGESKSCNCLLAELNRERSTHGLSPRTGYTPEYGAFHAAKGRCNNPKDAAYKFYGGRGVEFHLASVNDMIAEIGLRPTAKHSLDRYPNLKGNYESGNIRWATKREQAQNRRSNRLLTAFGECLPLIEWARRVDIDHSVLHARLKRGWCVECAVSIPSKGGVCPHKSTQTVQPTHPK